jgi:hypothetical protein
MLNLKRYLYLITSIILLNACTKTTFEDTSFVGSANAPAKLSAMYNITQDNTGNVTITPNGEGLAYTLVYFGDNTASPADVPAGKSITHKYGEGTYTVKLRGVTVNGLTTEATQPLTVSFRKPENVKMTAVIDASNKFQVNVSAEADFETFFHVYFGEDPNQAPVPFLEGETTSYVYSMVGKYTIRVVALSGGAATTEVTQEVDIVNPVLLPVDFEDLTQSYPFINFDGGMSTVIDNPHKNVDNNTNRVARMVKNPGQPWGGSLLALGEPINFSQNKIFRMKVYSPRAGTKVLLKVENPTNGSISYEQEVTTTRVNAWEDLVFDFSAIDVGQVYQNIVLIFDLGTPGDGSANFTWFYDDIRLTGAVPVERLELPLTFESTTLTYGWFDFDGGNATVIDNPDRRGINTSSKVTRMVKNAGQPWGGSFLTLDGPINFFASKTFKMKVWSPRVGARVLLKVENSTNASLNYEVEAASTKAGEWEELTFDYSGVNTANTYNRIVIICDLGTPGNGSANFTWYLDDITLNGIVPPPSDKLAIPLNFESSTLNYDWFDFDGGNATVIDNPDKRGINTSNRVTRMVKNAGQPWGGSFLTLDEPINFAGGTTIKVKVWSPRVGARMLFKVENSATPSINAEIERASTKAGEWEELSFTLPNINLANRYDRIVIICDLGTPGNGTADFTWYFDDITF